MSNINIKYENKYYKYEKGTSLNVIKEDFKENYQNDILLASVNNVISNLSLCIEKDSDVLFYDISSRIGNDSYKKALMLIFINSVKNLLNCDVKFTYCFENALYCNVLTNEIISEVTVEKIRQKMNDIIESKSPISKINVSRMDAIDYYKKINQLDKVNSLRYISNSNINLYRLNDSVDYFFTVLPSNADYIKNFKIKFIGNNKVVLLFPFLSNIDKKLEYEKNNKIIDLIDYNDKILDNLSINTIAELNNLISQGKYEDVISISENIQNNKLIEVSNKIVKDKNLKVILITGPSSSGKTTISKKLCMFLKSLGKNPISISVDDYYVDLDKRMVNESGKPEMEDISAIDVPLFNKKMSDLLSGNYVSLPKYDFELGKKIEQSEKVKIEENDLIIIEGIHAFNETLTEMIPNNNKFKIFISPITPLNIDNHNYFDGNDNRLIRRIVRDNRKRGASASKSLEMWNDVRKSEEKNILPYAKYADEIINTSLLYELNVLKTYVEPLLFSVSEDDKNYSEAIRLINVLRMILSMPSFAIPSDSILREFIG